MTTEKHRGDPGEYSVFRDGDGQYSDAQNAAAHDEILKSSTQHDHFEAEHGGKQEEKNTGNLIADNAVRYINEHYGDDITLSELACLSGVSPQYFDRVFRERLNMRPMEYIARVKISKAKSMLLDCDMSVTQLSESLGYTSPTYFGIVFKKYEGISPSEFRKNSGSVI